MKHEVKNLDPNKWLNPREQLYNPTENLDHDPDDPFPHETLEDLWWAWFTRSAEAMMRWLRFWGDFT